MLPASGDYAPPPGQAMQKAPVDNPTPGAFQPGGHLVDFISISNGTCAVITFVACALLFFIAYPISC